MTFAIKAELCSTSGAGCTGTVREPAAEDGRATLQVGIDEGNRRYSRMRLREGYALDIEAENWDRLDLIQLLSGLNIFCCLEPRVAVATLG
jgi:hypothetical protein